MDRPAHALTEILPRIFLVTFMLQIGLSVAPRLLGDELARVGPIVRALVFFLVVQPLAAAAIVVLLRPDPPVVAALVLLSVAGLAPLSARTRDAAGNAPLALVLALLLGLVTVFTAPATSRWLLAYRGELAIAPGRLVARLLALEAAPLVAGVLIRGLTAQAQRLARVVGAINALLLAVVIALAVLPRLPTLAVLDWRGALAGVIFSVAAVLLGLVVGGAGAGEGRTLAMLANRPNVALALAILAAAQAAPPFEVALLAMFVLRLLVGVVARRFLARAPRPQRAPRRRPPPRPLPTLRPTARWPRVLPP